MQHPMQMLLASTAQSQICWDTGAVETLEHIKVEDEEDKEQENCTYF